MPAGPCQVVYSPVLSPFRSLIIHKYTNISYEFYCLMTFTMMYVYLADIFFFSRRIVLGCNSFLDMYSEDYPGVEGSAP